jgi:hypothetical protein
VIFSRRYLGRTVTMSALLTVSIVGLWAGAVYEPTAIVFLSRQAGMELPDAAKMASYGTGLLSIGTILGCIAAPWLAERLGRRSTLALYYFGMMVTIALAFGWAFYLPTGSALPTFMAALFFLGVFGGNFAIFSLWLPELFGTEARATAFAFARRVHHPMIAFRPSDECPDAHRWVVDVLRELIANGFADLLVRLAYQIVGGAESAQVRHGLQVPDDDATVHGIELCHIGWATRRTRAILPDDEIAFAGLMRLFSVTRRRICKALVASETHHSTIPTSVPRHHS